jgi:nicotinamidase/pyrazinamidase
MQRIDVIYIDFQNSFLDDGSLPVKGGRQAAQNAAKLLNRLGKKVTKVYASLDSHQNLHVFSPIWWLNKNNNHPDPYTTITYQEVLDGVWKTTLKSVQKQTENYLKELESKGKYQLMIWSRHCLINTPGWLIEDELSKSLDKWEQDNLRRVNYIAKGNNPMTEFYSAFEAEVPQPNDPSTQLNTQLITSLEEADLLVFGGLATDYCLKASMESIFNNFSNSDYLKKCVLLTDCTAAIQQQQADDFVKNMTAKGMKVSTSVDFLA